MQKKHLKYLLICTLAALGLSSCMEDRDNLYTGPTLVEFATLSSTKSVTVSATNVQNDSLLVQLVGPQQTAALALNYTLDATSTAVEGTHYTLPTKGTFTIPANSSFGYIRYSVKPGSITTGTFKAIFTLTGNDAIKPSENYKIYTLTFAK